MREYGKIMQHDANSLEDGAIEYYVPWMVCCYFGHKRGNAASIQVTLSGDGLVICA